MTALLRVVNGGAFRQALGRLLNPTHIVRSSSADTQSTETCGSHAFEAAVSPIGGSLSRKKASMSSISSGSAEWTKSL